MFSLDARQEASLSDAVYMLRLYKRVAYGLVPRQEPGGPRALLASFLAADRRCVASADPPLEPRAALNAAFSLFPTTLLPRQDVALLLHVLPLEEHHGEEGGVRLGDVLTALRHLIPFHSWQVGQVVQEARAVVEKSDMMSPLEEHVADLLDYDGNARRQASEPPPPPLSTRELLCFFDRVCGLSASKARLFAHYISGAEEEEVEDVRSVQQLLFAAEVPGVAEYPLLMARFAEASLDGGEAEPRPTGSRALLASLSSIELVYPAASHSTPLDLDFGALCRGEVSPRQFFYLCKAMQVGFEQRESDQLFYYLKREHHSSEGVAVADLIAAFRQYFPPVTMSMLQLVQSATIRWLRRSSASPLPFVELYNALRSWGTARIPIAAFLKAFRDAGVPDGVAGVHDVELEWLRLKAPTRVDLLLMLCSPVPASRAAVIGKLFERLDAAGDGSVQRAVCLQRFTPERIEGASVRRHVAPWKTAFAAYLDELDECAVDYDVFAYFWYMVSAGVEDDPTFSVAIWQGFGLSDDGRQPRRR